MAFLDETGLAEVWSRAKEKKNYKTGDIVTTVRTDLDDTWLLCNGDEVSVHDYSELSKMFPSLESYWTTTDIWSGTSNNNDIYSVNYINGYWVACGTYYDGTSFWARIAYATSPDGTWTIKDVWSTTSTGVGKTGTSIAYGNGYWVVGGQSYNIMNSKICGRIAYSTSLNGTWTTKDLWSNSGGSNGVQSVSYANGYWVAGGCYYTNNGYYARIAYATSPNGTWTTKDLWNGNGGGWIENITYAEGYWVAVGSYATSSEAQARIAYATSPDGTWTTKDLWKGANNGDRVYGVTYVNGYWVAGGKYSDDTQHYARLAYSTSLGGTWTIEDAWSSANVSFVSGITYANGNWVIGGTYRTSNSAYFARIAYSNSLSGPWKTKDLWGAGNDQSVNCIVSDPSYVLVSGSNGSKATIGVCNLSKFKLPVMSTDNAYIYVKAKE